MTIHNRREKTLSCLSALKFCNVNNLIYDVYLVDDGSTDGTSDEIKKLYPAVNIIQGTGTLFWAGGMRLAWQKASEKSYDGYMLLNDDTVLYPSAFITLLETHDFTMSTHGTPGICIGTTCDPVTGKFTSGGYKLKNKFSPHGVKVEPDLQSIQRCDVANANIMLVPVEIVKKIGKLSTRYTHSLADFDYTLRATKHGIPVMVCKQYCGTCIVDHDKSWMSGNRPLKERIRFLNNPKYLARREYLAFVKLHFPLYWPVSNLLLWVKTLFPLLWDTFKK